MGLISILGRTVGKFADDRGGVISVMFGLSVLVLIMGASGAFDLQRTYLARQELSAIASLTCQYANRPLVVSLASGSGGSAAYVASVNTFYKTALADQNFAWKQTNSTPFSFVPGGAGTVTLAATVPTTVMGIIGIKTIPVGVSIQCFSNLSSTPQPVPDASQTLIISESFENSAYPTSIGWYLPTGAVYPYSYNGTSFPTVNTPPSTPGYVGLSGVQWVIMGYCLEVDVNDKTQTTTPDGSHSAELDCDNGSGSAGNSSISTKIWLQAGNYELRYFYASRAPNTYYGQSYICGSTAADLSWANDAVYPYGPDILGKRTDQLNVYLDQNTTGSPPTHLTIDGTQYLAGSNLIDQCVYASQWIERSVQVDVTTAGYYWLSFAADGASDSFGADIDYIRVCQSTCNQPAVDDFPTAWLPSNHTNVVLYEDTFESPAQPSPATAKYFDGNLYNNLGASTAWGETTGKGWGNAPVNHALYFSSLCPEETLCVALGLNVNSAEDYWMAKPFLLDPGYYQIGYDYVSEVTFSALSSYPSGHFCGATPSAANISQLSGSGAAVNRVTGSSAGTIAYKSTVMGVFMANQMMASTPVPNSTLNDTTTYLSPSQVSETSPSVPPNSISLTNFSQSAVSPLIDICGYSSTSQHRTVNVKIVKPGLYWLVFSLFSPYAGYGAVLDDVTITALGSIQTTTPPNTFVSIPVPSPAPGSTLSFTGFSITADKY